MRLNRYLARAGIASRRAADELIKDGRVRVNGVARRARAHSSRRATSSRWTGSRSGSSVLRTCSCTSRSESSRRYGIRRAGRPSSTSSATMRGSCRSAGSTSTRRVPSCSRTTATSPTVSPIPATASRRSTWRMLQELPATTPLRRLAAGVELDDGRTAPARICRLGRSRLELVLHEGRNRQVRRMCEAVGHPVRRLHRSGVCRPRSLRRRGRLVACADAGRGRAACAASSGWHSGPPPNVVRAIRTRRSSRGSRRGRRAPSLQRRRPRRPP